MTGEVSDKHNIAKLFTDFGRIIKVSYSLD